MLFALYVLLVFDGPFVVFVDLHPRSAVDFGVFEAAKNHYVFLIYRESVQVA